MIRTLKQILLVVLYCGLCGLVDGSDIESPMKLDMGLQMGIVEKTRDLMVDSTFHVYLGGRLSQGGYSLHHVCSYADATYMFGIAPNLGSIANIVSYFDHDVFTAALDSTPQDFKIITIQFTDEHILTAYSLTLGILTAGNTKKIQFQGVIFYFASDRYFFDFVFDEDMSDEMIYEFFAIYADLHCAGLPAPLISSISFNKTPEEDMVFSWDLWVNSLDKSLITLNNKTTLIRILDNIHPTYLAGLTLARSDHIDRFLMSDLHELSFSSSIKRTELIVHQAIQNIEVGDLKVFGAKMNKGLDSVVAISFGVLSNETIDIKFKYIPNIESITEQEIELKEAVSQMEGFWFFTQKYFKADYWKYSGHKEVVLECWYGKTMKSQHSLKSIASFLALAREQWNIDRCPENLCLVMRPPASIDISQHTPFVRLGFADFFTTDLPIIVIRLYNLLFVWNTAEWTDLIDSIILRPAGTTMKNESSGNNLKYEVLIGIREGPSIKDMNIQTLMADIMYGVSHASSFANGLFKSSDGSVPLLQFGSQAYHKQALATIQKSMKITRSGNVGEIGALQVYSFLYLPFLTYPLGAVETAFDDVFLDSIDITSQIGTFLCLSKFALSRGQLQNFTYELKSERLLELMRTSARWALHAKSNAIDTLHGMAIQVVPIKKELEVKGIVRIGFGFATNSLTEDRQACTEFFGIDLSECKNAGNGNLMDEFDDPHALDTIWTLSFKHGDETVTRSFSDLAWLQYYMSWFKPEVLKTACVVQDNTLVGPQIIVDCRESAMVRMLLFDHDDMWNILDGKSWIYLWTLVFKVEFAPNALGHGDEGISVVLHFKSQEAVQTAVRLLHRRRMLLELIDPFQFTFNSALAGKLKIGDHAQYILGANTFYESMRDWPGKIDRKDILSFRKINDPRVTAKVDKIHAIRIVVETKKMVELYALTMNMVLGRISPDIAELSYSLIVRNLAAHTKTKKGRNKIPRDHVECILAFSKPLGENLPAFAKTLFLLAAVLEDPVIDVSAGIYGLKSQAYIMTKTMTFGKPADLSHPTVEKIIKNVLEPKSDLKAPVKKVEPTKPDSKRSQDRISAADSKEVRLAKAIENSDKASKNLEEAKLNLEIASKKYQEELSVAEEKRKAGKEAKEGYQSAASQVNQEIIELKQANERLNRLKRLERKKQHELENLIKSEGDQQIKELHIQNETAAMAAPHKLVNKVHLLSNSSTNFTTGQRRRMPSDALTYDAFH